MNLAVVVNAFDRPHGLDRLLRSLSLCHAEPGTDLVISVDGGGRRREAVLAVAASARWEHGAVKLLERDDLGLVGHFRACGDLVDELGPLVMLEDDLVVGPHALRFATAALDFASTDERIAGVSLSTPWFDGFRHLRFEPLLDGSDVICAKVPWFHGMAWTPDQWHRHRGGAFADPSTTLPAAFSALDEDEWFPDAVRDLVEHDRWYVLSRRAHAVNFGDAGVHFDHDTTVFQQPLVGGQWREPCFVAFGTPGVVSYDELMEPDARSLTPLVPELEGRDVTMDLRGVRDLTTVTTEWVVTSRPVRRAAHSWGAVMRPLEQNLLSAVPGAELSLCRTCDVRRGRIADAVASSVVAGHSSGGSGIGIRQSIRRRVDDALATLAVRRWSR